MVATPMMRALDLARAAAGKGEVPVGAVVIGPDGSELAACANATLSLCDPTAHAEVLALREASRRLAAWRLDGCDLYVTLEPCAMCAGAIALARIRRLYYGAPDPKGGAVDHGPRLFDSPTCHHRPEVYGGIGERMSAEMLRGFFASRR